MNETEMRNLMAHLTATGWADVEVSDRGNFGKLDLEADAVGKVDGQKVFGVFARDEGGEWKEVEGARCFYDDSGLLGLPSAAHQMIVRDAVLRGYTEKQGRQIADEAWRVCNTMPHKEADRRVRAHDFDYAAKQEVA